MIYKTLMPIPRPHLLMLELLKAWRDKDDSLGHGLIGWAAAMPEGIDVDPKLLFIPLLERGLIENGERIRGDKGGSHFVCITDVGIKCLAYGYMPVQEMHPTDDDFLLMAGAPKSPTLYIDATVDEIVAADMEDAVVDAIEDASK